MFLDFYDAQELPMILVGIAVMVPLMGLAASIPAALLGSRLSPAFVRAVIAHGIINGSLLIIAYATGGLYMTYLVAHTAFAAVVSLLPLARSSPHLLIVPGSAIVLIALFVDLVGGDPLTRFYWAAPFLFSVLAWTVLTLQAGRVQAEVRRLDDPLSPEA